MVPSDDKSMSSSKSMDGKVAGSCSSMFSVNGFVIHWSEAAGSSVS